MPDRFADITDAELVIGEDEFRAHLAVLGDKIEWSIGPAGPHDSRGNPYVERNYMLDELTMDNIGLPVQCSKREFVAMMKDLFFSSLGQRRWTHAHDTIELRLWPEIDFSHNGRFGKFYARLSTYQSAELLAEETAMVAKLRSQAA